MFSRQTTKERVRNSFTPGHAYLPTLPTRVSDVQLPDALASAKQTQFRVAATCHHVDVLWVVAAKVPLHSRLLAICTPGHASFPEMLVC